MPELHPLKRRTLPHDTFALARWLLGKIVVRRVGRAEMSGRIVETEAYVPADAASHAYRGETPRNRAMFQERGHAYVYFIYGVHFMLNISSDAAGIGAGVLIRALEPLSGVAQMQRNRGKQRLVDLTRGPGALAQALRIDRTLDGVDMCQPGPLFLASDRHAPAAINAGPRIGITKNASPLWRFYVKDNAYVSGSRRAMAQHGPA